MQQYEITDSEFESFKHYIYQSAGISLGPEKRTLIITRLSKRLRHYSLDTFSDYFDLMIDSPQNGERQVVIDLLTTNETYFFREPKHFAFMEKHILSNWKGGNTFRVWSAASSTGEEAYSIAMLLDHCLATMPWEIYGTDISTRVVAAARKGHYLQNRIDGIPEKYLKKYCLKGVGDQEGTLLIDKKLRNHVRFDYTNLTLPIKDVGMFNIIFLRNVLIYFDVPTKKFIVKQLIEKLCEGGYLFIGHSETLHAIDTSLKVVEPAIYQKC